jgi:hypothetical protein
MTGVCFTSTKASKGSILCSWMAVIANSRIACGSTGFVGEGVVEESS